VNGAFISRNAGSGFDFLSLGLRLSRAFQITERVRLNAIAEAFNATNHVNGVTLNGVFGSATFRQMTSVGDPRSFQLALRLSF
jgi:homoserine kinase